MSLEECYVCNYCDSIFRIYDKQGYVYHLREHAFERIHIRKCEKIKKENIEIYNNLMASGIDAIDDLLKLNLFNLRNFLNYTSNLIIDYNNYPEDDNYYNLLKQTILPNYESKYIGYEHLDNNIIYDRITLTYTYKRFFNYIRSIENRYNGPIQLQIVDNDYEKKLVFSWQLVNIDKNTKFGIESNRILLKNKLKS